MADLDALIEHASPGLRFVVSTRVDPQLRLQRLRVAGQLTEIRMADLAFTLPEDLQAIYRERGIELAQGNGDGTWRLPVPARIVIDRQGIIRAVDADPDYTRRPEPAQTVEILERLRRTPSA